MIHAHDSGVKFSRPFYLHCTSAKLSIIATEALLPEFEFFPFQTMAGKRRAIVAETSFTGLKMPKNIIILFGQFSSSS
jgi:hypothetical protein